MWTIKLLIIILFISILLYPGYIYVTSYSRNNFASGLLNLRLNYDSSNLAGMEALASAGYNGSSSIQYAGNFTCANGLYLGPVDIFESCEQKCSSDDYVYRYIKDNEHVIINSKKLTGAYCLLKDVAACNLNVSYVVSGVDGYRCVSIFPQLLGGRFGNEIVGCRSKGFKDHLMQSVYYYFIPNNLVFHDIDELLPNGTHRFECVLNSNEMNLPRDIGSRFETEHNLCTVLDPAGAVDMEAGKCICTNYIDRDTSRPCTHCVSGWAISSKQHGAMYGYSVARDCVDPTAATYVETKVVRFPCGMKTIGYKRKCEHAVVNVTNTYSPMALENMFG